MLTLQKFALRIEIPTFEMKQNNWYTKTLRTQQLILLSKECFNYSATKNIREHRTWPCKIENRFAELGAVQLQTKVQLYCMRTH